MIRIVFTFRDGTPNLVFERPHHKSPEAKTLARRMKMRLGLPY
jgi:hypothetical protein